MNAAGLAPEATVTFRTGRGILVCVVGRDAPAGPRTAVPEADPAETRLAAGLPAARRADFLIGRRAAGLALALLSRAGPVLRAANGQPVFPADVAGSISHCDGYGVCAAAPGALAVGALAVGVDLELEGRVPAAGLRHFATEAERAWIARSRDDAEAAYRTTSVFCAKEAVYKARGGGARNRYPTLELLPRPGGFVMSRPDVSAVAVRRVPGPDAANYVLATAWEVTPR
nr:phosphopantetheinyl transferase [Streptomyces sp. WM6386]